MGSPGTRRTTDSHTNPAGEQTPSAVAPANPICSLPVPKRLHKDDYAAAKKPVLLDIAPAAYLVVNGQGAPGGERFTASIGALYGMAFTITGGA